MSSEDEDPCPSFLWYFVASFGYTILILVILLAYIIMYSSHFMWALRKQKGAASKTTKTTTRTSQSKSKSAEKTDESNEKKSGSKEKVSNDTNEPKESGENLLPHFAVHDTVRMSSMHNFCMNRYEQKDGSWRNNDRNQWD
ncbi:unnamed protein product [Anisakis simplex]|uniref:Uncharacterized protein n=1 Tax=Anisakis simplex TaxID=6269 RepID=A0A0M3K5W5_ANISI|nr:unnamed protein product [Anisakis simplex]